MIAKLNDQITANCAEFYPHARILKGKANYNTTANRLDSYSPG